MATGLVIGGNCVFRLLGMLSFAALALAPLGAQAPVASEAAAPVTLAPAPPPGIDQTHADLRALKDRLVVAVNKQDAAAMLAELDGDVRLTTMDSVLSKGTGGTKAYYDRMMTGANRVVDQMKVTAEPDDLSQILPGGNVALTTGTANAHFRIAGGKEMDVPLRWTATLVNRDGQWKVLAAQFSANMFDNPMMNGIRSLSYWLAGGAALVGLVLGWLLGRRKTAA